MAHDLLEHKLSPKIKTRAPDETKVLAGFSDWLIGLLSIGGGIIAILIAVVVFCVPLTLVGEFTFRFSGSGSSTSMGLAFPISVVLIGILFFWFAFRFFYPALFDLVKLSGFFLQKLADVRPSDVLAIMKQRTKNMANDFRFLTGWLRDKN